MKSSGDNTRGKRTVKTSIPLRVPVEDSPKYVEPPLPAVHHPSLNRLDGKRSQTVNGLKENQEHATHTPERHQDLGERAPRLGRFLNRCLYVIRH